jgi:hypothetical protein
VIVVHGSLPFFQSFNRGKYLPHLMGFRFALAVLDIYAGIARPRHFVNSGAGALLAWLAKIMIAYSA